MKERILMFIEHYLEISTAAFEKSVSLSNGFVHNIGDSVREKTIAKISLRYPELNINWWKTGEGNMLVGERDAEKKELITIKPSDFYKIIILQQQFNEIQKDFNTRLIAAQEQLTESQKQITLLLKILQEK